MEVSCALHDYKKYANIMNEQINQALPGVSDRACGRAHIPGVVVCMKNRLNKLKPFQLPRGFLLGAATAATQIEGGDENNNWSDWCRQGKIRDRTSCVRANDHWNRYKDDIRLMQQLHIQTYRMGLEWSRIEPKSGQFNEEAIAHYRDELMLLRKAGITPLVTLHHFSHPLWLCKEGEFEKKSVVRYFERYVRYVVERIGDLVSDFITINEPNVYVTQGYFLGKWPPGKRSIPLMARVYRNMTLCHIAAYRAIHEVRSKMGFPGKTMVGVAHNVCVFAPYHWYNPLDSMAACSLSYLLQDSVMRMMVGGRVPVLMRPFVHGVKPGRYFDFIGINYYQRMGVRFKGFRQEVLPGAPKNDLGWEIYPQGLEELCKRFYRQYHAPIWITENGTCDNTDSFRARYIADHLEAVRRAIDAGVPVERYYHWSIIDNFEWAEGESARFGLIHCDYETQRRSIKNSGRIYGEICRDGGISPQVAREIEKTG